MALLAILLAAPPSASLAATAKVEGRVLIYAAEGDNDNTLEVSGPACYSVTQGPCPPDRILIHLLDFGTPFGRPSGGEPMTPGAGCARAEDIFGPPGPGQPPTFQPPDRDVYCSGDVDSLDISLAGGDDWLFVSSDKPGVLRGQDGNDLLEDGSNSDLVDGGTGNDVFRAKVGNDSLFGGDGSDSYYALQCPPPPQACDPATSGSQGTGSDSFSGGTGRDTADFSDVLAGERLSANGVSDDGKLGEGDNIASDVEDIRAGPLNDTLLGNASDNRLDGGAGDDSVRGAAGQDVLQGAAGQDLLDGEAGRDRLEGGAGPDTLDGGPGRDSAGYEDRSAGVAVTLDDRRNDGQRGERDNVSSTTEDVLGGRGPDDLTGSAGSNRLDGGRGEDFVDGRAGADALVGGGAADMLRLRDGSADSAASCGRGIDFVIADPGESANADCEGVDDVLRDRPSLGRRVAVKPRGTTLALQLPAAHRFVPLLDHVNIPVRSLIDTKAAPARVTSSVGVSRRKRRSGVFSGGLFQILQARRGRDRGITELRLRGSNFNRCGTAGGKRASSAGLSRRALRRLRASAGGRFRTRGRYSAATVRGTKWITTDRCDGTLTRVTRGRVAVRDFRRKRTIVVRAGKSYLARAAR